MKTYLQNEPVQLLIFDMDGTFYPAEFYTKKYYEFLHVALDHFFNYTYEQTDALLEDYGIYPYFDPKAKSGTDLIVGMGVSIQEWNDYRNQNYVLTGFAQTQCVDPHALEALKQDYDLYLVSNNTYPIIVQTLGEIGIKEDVFTHIYHSLDLSLDGKKQSKDFVYKKIHEATRVDYKHMVAIGDRYSVDLEPLIKLGGQGIQVDHPYEIHDIQDLLRQ